MQVCVKVHVQIVFHPYIMPEVEGLDGERLAVTLWGGWRLDVRVYHNVPGTCSV